MGNKKVLCIGAHPDDSELGMAATLAKHRDLGDEAHIIICSLGIGGESGDPKIRESEATEAANILGARLNILDYPVTKLNKPSPEFYQTICKAIEDLHPDRVYTHSPYDYHQVHETVSECVSRAARDIPQLLYYEVASSTSPDFRPNAYSDVTDYIQHKIRCLAAHRTQSSKLYMQESIIKSLAHSRYVLSKIGTKPNGLAEAFYVGRLILSETISSEVTRLHLTDKSEQPLNVGRNTN